MYQNVFPHRVLGRTTRDARAFGTRGRQCLFSTIQNVRRRPFHFNRRSFLCGLREKERAMNNGWVKGHLKEAVRRDDVYLCLFFLLRIVIRRRVVALSSIGAFFVGQGTKRLLANRPNARGSRAFRRRTRRFSL